jgi:excisionase family DNA binding protein
MTPNASWSGLVDVKWVARHLGIAEKKVRELARIGDLKAIRIGKSWRFDPHDLEAGLEAGIVRHAQSGTAGGQLAAEHGSIAASCSLTAAVANTALDEPLTRRTVESVIAALSDPDVALPDGVVAAAVEVSDHTFVLRTAPGSPSETARALVRELARALRSER